MSWERGRGAGEAGYGACRCAEEAGLGSECCAGAEHCGHIAIAHRDRGEVDVTEMPRLVRDDHVITMVLNIFFFFKALHAHIYLRKTSAF